MNIFQSFGNWVSDLSHRLPASKRDIEQLTERIDMKHEELLVGLIHLKDQAVKSRAEILGAVNRTKETIAALEKQVNDLNNGELPPEIAQAFDALRAEVQNIDDINQDEPAPGAPVGA